MKCFINISLRLRYTLNDCRNPPTLIRRRMGKIVFTFFHTIWLPLPVHKPLIFFLVTPVYPHIIILNANQIGMWLIWATYINMSPMVLSLTLINATIHTSSLVCIMTWSQDIQKPIHPKLSHQLLLNQSNVYSQVFLECFLHQTHVGPSLAIYHTLNIPISNLLLNSNKRMGITSFWNWLILWFMFPSSTQLYVMHLQYRKRGACN